MFRKIKFFGLCINGPNNYRRPSLFLRKYLFRYVINDRGATYKRVHTTELQADLTKEDVSNNKDNLEVKLKNSNILKKKFQT